MFYFYFLLHLISKTINHLTVLAIIVINTNNDVAVAVKPPGYIEKPKVHDDNPPKYEYGYTVASDDNNGNDGGGGSQGHKEIRDGDNTKGNYYVNLPSGQSQADVRYIADDWGYHPLVR